MSPCPPVFSVTIKLGLWHSPCSNISPVRAWVLELLGFLCLSHVSCPVGQWLKLAPGQTWLPQIHGSLTRIILACEILFRLPPLYDQQIYISLCKEWLLHLLLIIGNVNIFDLLCLYFCVHVRFTGAHVACGIYHVYVTGCQYLCLISTLTVCARVYVCLVERLAHSMSFWLINTVNCFNVSCWFFYRLMIFTQSLVLLYT